MKDAKVGNDAIETAAWVFMTADSVACGGEVKFQVFKEWDYDHFLKVTNTYWTELKTCDFYAMARVPDVKWYVCFYFYMAAHTLCAAMVCTRMKINKNNLSMAVFPSPRCAVAKKITAAIRNYLPALLSKESKDKFSSRSLCQGAITELSMHSAITLFQACARSGHSMGTSLDSYIDKRNVAKTLPTANALDQQHKR